MKTISTQQLKEMRQRGEPFTLVNVLSREKFQQEHIPGSRNVPVEEENFVREVERILGDRNKKVVVYCASTDCDASPKAARRLEEAGFRDVLDYEGGMKAWREAELEVATVDA